MPRRPRPDLVPEVWIADTSASQRKVNSVLSVGERAKVRRNTATYSEDNKYHVTYDAFGRRMSELCRQGANINWSIILTIASKCEFATSVPVTQKDGTPVTRLGLAQHRMMSVGCRTHIKQDDIASELGLSRTYVCEQIGELKKHGLIVNSGKGWYELDARHFWRGDPDLRNAYVVYQQGLAKTIITDGTTTVVMHMDADLALGDEPS